MSNIYTDSAGTYTKFAVQAVEVAHSVCGNTGFKYWFCPGQPICSHVVTDWSGPLDCYLLEQGVPL